jgi:hypothetical protein
MAGADVFRYRARGYKLRLILDDLLAPKALPNFPLTCDAALGGDRAD